MYDNVFLVFGRDHRVKTTEEHSQKNIRLPTRHTQMDDEIKYLKRQNVLQRERERKDFGKEKNI